MNLDITFLGTGTSQGVPVIGCPCAVCQSTDLRDKRLRSSVLVSLGDFHLVIDSGPDFRQQMLVNQVWNLDAVLFTHGHKDHVAGLDDIRAYNYTQKRAMDVYADERVEVTLRREFSYIFNDEKYPGVPEINLHHINSNPFDIGPLHIIPLEVMHYKLPVLGFRIGDFSYVTDANAMPESTRALIRGSRVLVLNALRKEKHISHFTLNEAIDLARDLRCETTYFTHISHQLGKHAEVSEELPEGMYLAYDGLKVSIPFND